MSRAQIRVAQITDMHVTNTVAGEVQGVKTYQRFCSVMEEVAKQDYDCVFFTGDCSEDGSAESYALINDQLKGLRAKTKFILGNHDSRKLYDALGETPIEEDRIRSFLNWELLFLHSKVDGESYGLLGDSELDLLQEFSQSNSSKNKGVVLHHNPISVGCGQSDLYMLQNNQVFIDIIKKDPAMKIVLFGHVHNDHQYKIDNISFECAPSTGFQFNDGSVLKIDRSKFGYKEYIFTEEGVMGQAKWSYADAKVA